MTRESFASDFIVHFLSVKMIPRVKPSTELDLACGSAPVLCLDCSCWWETTDSSGSDWSSNSVAPGTSRARGDEAAADEHGGGNVEMRHCASCPALWSQ